MNFIKFEPQQILAEFCTFSTASREALFFPFLKYSSLALYHGTLSPAVRAAKCSSPGAGSESSSRICWIVLYRKCIMKMAMLLFPEMFHLWYYNVDTCFKEISDNSEHSLVFWSVYQSVCLSLLFLFLKSGQFVHVVKWCHLFSVFMTKINNLLNFKCHNKISDTVYILFNFHWF